MDDSNEKPSRTNILSDERWERRFSELEAYYGIHGVGVCVKRGDNPTLAQWVADQRRFHKQGKLSKERRDRLDQIGIHWRVRIDSKAQFTKLYTRLVTYKEEHGDCLVPWSYHDAGLHSFVARKRSAFQDGNLPKYQTRLLNEIGFVWNTDQTDGEKSIYQKQWDTMFQRLLDFKEKFGHCEVKTSYRREDKALVNWVVGQRQRQRKGKLPPHRFKRLDDIGFKWTTRENEEDNWNENFDEAKDYALENGWDLEAAQPKLGWWARCQRFMRRKECLSEWKVEKLDEIGFPWGLDETDSNDDDGDGDVPTSQAHDDRGSAKAELSCRFEVGSRIERAIPNCALRFLGHIIDHSNDLYHVKYDNGNEEQVDHHEVESMLCNRADSKPRGRVKGQKESPPSVAEEEKEEDSKSGSKPRTRPKRPRAQPKEELSPAESDVNDESFESASKWDEGAGGDSREDENVESTRLGEKNRVRRKRRRNCVEGDTLARDENNLKHTIGTRVRKRFGGHGWFEGVVTSHQNGWTRVVYEDGDIEEYYQDHVKSIEVYHEGRGRDPSEQDEPKFSIGTRVKKLFRKAGLYWGIVTSFAGGSYRVMFDDGSIKEFSEQELSDLIFRKTAPSTQKQRFLLRNDGTRGLYPVGTEVRKYFNNHGWFTGIIKSNEAKYHVEYSDGDCEEYLHDSQEIETIVEAAGLRNL